MEAAGRSSLKMDPSAHLSPPPEAAGPNPATELTNFLFLLPLSSALVPPPSERNSVAKGLFFLSLSRAEGDIGLQNVLLKLRGVMETWRGWGRGRDDQAPPPRGQDGVRSTK